VAGIQWLPDRKVQGLSTYETVCSKVNSLRILQVCWAADHSALPSLAGFPDEGRVPHISLIFREMWDTTLPLAVDSSDP